MTNPKEQLVCGGNVFQLVLIIIFQLTLYMIDNDCQLEIYTFFRFNLNIMIMLEGLFLKTVYLFDYLLRWFMVK